MAVAVVAYVVGGAVALRSDARKRAREGAEAVLSKADVLHGALDQSPLALIVLDRFQDLILSNDRAGDLDLVDDGRHVAAEVWDAVTATFTGGEEVRFQIPAHTSGRRRIPSVSGRATFLRTGGEKFVVVFADDDSEQRRMESARRDFVANVSHELKTPVGAMAVLAEALLESKDDPEAVTYFGERVVAEAHRLGSMVTELIELSRLQGAERIRDPELVSVDEVVQEAMLRFTSAAEANEIQLTSDAPSGLEVMGDKTLLVTAVSNLISNAINYSPANTPVVVARSSEAGIVQIRVTDHGIGIAPENQGRVFERFFRVDKARSRATGGTGLGLAIVKHVVNNHNGQVRLWSRPGMGSTFTLELPAHEEPSGRLEDAADEAPPKKKTSPLRAGAAQKLPKGADVHGGAGGARTAHQPDAPRKNEETQ